MRVLERRGRTALGGLTIAIVLISATAAEAASFPNACKNSVTANNSQVGVTMAASSSTSVNPGNSLTLSNIQQSVSVPGGIFVAGYNIGLLNVGANTIPATVVTKIAATNTVEGSQSSSTESSSIATTITDPDGSPGTGDEAASDGDLNATYDDQTWTAGGALGTIDFREETIQPLSTGTGALHTGGIKISALVGGVLPVRFACSPGTVTGPDPGTIALDDPAVAIASTTIVAPPSGTPTADAGPDQTVASGANVDLNGSGSSDPDGDPLTYDWTQTAGPSVTLSGAGTATPSFTAPTGPATLSFELEVCDDGGPPLCDSDAVVVEVNAPNQAPTADADADLTVDSGAAVNLSGSGSSDPDGDPLIYSWTQSGGTAVTLSGAGTATPSFTAPTGPATLSFELEVCDDGGPPLCDTDAVVVNVEEPENPAPVITGLKVTPKRFSASEQPTALQRRRGAEIKLTLSEDATVRFRIRRQRPPRQGGPPPRHPRKFKRVLSEGSNSVDFTGTLGKLSFKPRAYTLTARARDSAKRPSEFVTTRFEILP